MGLNFTIIIIRLKNAAHKLSRHVVDNFYAKLGKLESLGTIPIDDIAWWFILIEYNMHVRTKKIWLVVDLSKLAI